MGLRTNNIVSRGMVLAIALGVIVNKDYLTEGKELLPGVVLGKLADGTYRPYAEAELTAASDSASANLAFDPASLNFENFKVGDVVEGVDGTALGTILLINSVTGAVVLTGNAASDAYEGFVRVAIADLSVTKADVRILAEHVQYESLLGTDVSASGFVEGYFHKSGLTFTSTLISQLEIVERDGELRVI